MMNKHLAAQGRMAGRRFAKKGKMGDQSIYRTAMNTLGDAQLQRTARTNASVQDKRKMLSSLSRRTTDSSRKRVLTKLLKTYGQQLRP